MSDPAIASVRPRGWMRRLTLFALIVLLAIAVLIVRARAFDDRKPPTMASIADTIVVLPDGRPTPLGTLLHPGLPTVVALWASWCGPCRREAPKIAELQQRAATRRVNLLYLNVRDPGPTRAELNDALRSMGLREDGYAILPDAAVERITNGGGGAIPHTLLFDRNGAGQASVTGYNPLALDRLIALLDS